MFEMIAIYIWPLLAGVVMAPTLAILGCHLAARDRAMQTLCLGQGATLGVLIGMGLIEPTHGKENFYNFVPFATAALFSTGTYYFTEKFFKKQMSSKNTSYSATYIVLLALGYVVCATFPHLENHMSQVFFGDLATISDAESKFTLGLGAILLFLLHYFWRSFTYESFTEAIFGNRLSSAQKPLVALGFKLLCLVTLSFSVQFLGFVFTISCMFLPTTLSLFYSKKLATHFSLCTFIVIVATASGFLLSLKFSRLPTAPLISVLILILGLLPMPFTLGVKR